MRSRGARSRSSRGQVATEMALVLPIFILVLVGVFDLGRAVFSYNAVANAAREATRVAIVDQRVTAIQDIAAQRSIGMGVAPSSVDVAFRNPDLSSGAPCSAGSVQIGCMAEVTVSYVYVAATPLIGNFIGPITISATSRQAVERSNP